MIKRNRAFSLIEVLIVLAIIGLIASLVLPVVQRNRDSAGYEVSMMNLYEVAKAMEKHYLEKGTYPVFTSWQQVASQDSPLREYLNDIPLTDAFGREYNIIKSNETEYEFEGFGVKGGMSKELEDYAFATGMKKKGGGVKKG